MERKIRFLAAVLLLFALCACHRGRTDDIIAGPYTPAISSPIKITVADVSNDTRQVFDVDVVGLLWTGLEDALRKRGMLWTSAVGGEPYIIEARVVGFKKGSAPGRLVPWVGDTVLDVRCELREGTRQIASVESRRKISYGHSLMSRAVWRQLFSEVAEEAVSEMVRKL